VSARGGARTVADVIVVGGGVAGSTLALSLARAGLGVELFEQHRFPREKPCAEGLMPAGVAVLDRLGVPAARAGAAFFGIRYHGFGRAIAAGFPRPLGSGEGATVGRGQRRLHLDAALFAACQAAGVSAQQGVRVEGPIVEAGRVRGVRVDGQERRAPLVVAADGPRSILRRRLGLDRRRARAARIGIRQHFRLAAGQAIPREVEIYLAEGHEIYVTPLPAGEISVAALAASGVVSDEEEGRAGGRETPAHFFRRALAGQPQVMALLEGAAPSSALGGRTPLAGGARRGWLPGLVLLGDAAATLDPITGGGMAQALITAELLAAALVRRSRPGGPVEFDPSHDVLEAFDRRRAAIYREAAALAALVLTLVRHPRLARGAFALLERWPALYQHLVGVAAGSRALVPL
jgi:flavin-dependent dehydrogenase